MKIKFYLLLLVFIGGILNSNSQNIAYPVQAQNIVRKLDSTTLYVKIAFPQDLGSGTTITVKFPQSIEYIPGSIQKISSVGNLNILESNISDLQNVVFRVGQNALATGSIFIGQDIEFRIKRKAGCGIANSGKDKIFVFNSVLLFSDTTNNINGYNILSPVLNFLMPTATNNQFINTNITRTFSIVNGGQGCTDTVTFSAKFDNPDLNFVSLSCNGNSIVPFLTIGSTKYFKIFGTTLGTNKLLCNSQTLDFTEISRLTKCMNETETNYTSSWGNFNTPCEIKNAKNTIILAQGTAVPIVSENITQSTSHCRQGEKVISLFNDGTNGKAGVMYNLSFDYFYNQSYPSSTLAISDPIRLNRLKFTSTNLALPFTYINNNNPYKFDFSNFTTDPDGINFGLDDLDGDGKFNDLAPGKTLQITMYEDWVCSTTQRNYFSKPNLKITYKNMCSDSIIKPQTYPANAFYDYLFNAGSEMIYPLDVNEGQVFNISFKVVPYYSGVRYFNDDSLIVEFTLPPGISYVGNPQLNGVSLPSNTTLIVSGNVVRFATKPVLFSSTPTPTYTFSFDAVLNCTAAGSNRSGFINTKVFYKADKSCVCTDIFATRSDKLIYHCPGCSIYIANYKPFVKRLSLGFIDYFMSNKINPTTMTSLSSTTFLATDTLDYTSTGIQRLDRNTLKYRLFIEKISGSNLFTYLSSTLYHKNHLSGNTSSYPVTIPPSDQSTPSTQVFRFDLINYLPGSIIYNLDSVWLITKFVINDINDGAFDGAIHRKITNSLSYFYNNTDAAPEYCDEYNADMYLLGYTKTLTEYSNPKQNSGCVNALMDFDFRTIYSGSSNYFPNEYRPILSIDSMEINFANGISQNPSVPIRSFIVDWNMGNSSLITNSLTPLSSYSTNPQIVGTQKIKIKNNGFATSGGWPHASIGNYSNYASDRIVIPFYYDCIWATSGSPGSVKYWYKDKRFNFSATTSKTDSITSGISIFNQASKTKIQLTNTSGTIIVSKKQQSFTLEIVNLNSAAPNSWWFGIERPDATTYVLDSVINLANNQNMLPILLNGGNTATKRWFVFNNNTNALTQGVVKKFRVVFKINKCTPDSLKISAGWDCNFIPNNPDPSTNTCVNALIPIRVTPELSKFQLFVSKQPKSPDVRMCSKDSLEIIYMNPHFINVYDPYIIYENLQGLNINPVAKVEYPRNSGNWQNITASLIGTSFLLNLTLHSGITTNGINGINFSNDSSLRQVRIRIFYEPSCEFISGQKLIVFGYGKSPCNGPTDTDGNFIFTNKIQIFGADPGGVSSVDLNITANILSCNNEIITIRTTPLLDNFLSEDSILIRIPNAIQLVNVISITCPPFTINGVDCSLSQTPLITIAATYTDVKIKLPEGLSPSEIFEIKLEVKANENYGCGTYVVRAQAVRKTSGIRCISTNTDCETSASLLAEDLEPMFIIKPSLNIISFYLQTPLGQAAQQGQTYNYISSVFNSSTTATSPAGTIMEILCQGSNTPLGFITLPAIPPLQTMPVNGSITLNPAVTGCYLGFNLIARIYQTTAAGAIQCLCSNNIFTSPTILPLNQLSFTGKNIGISNKINWNLSSAIGIKKIDLEKLDYNQIYSNIYTEDIDNNTKVNNSYIDYLKSENSINKYRLKITEVDNRITYSKEITIKSEQLNDLTVYPNPVMEANKINVRFNLKTKQNITIQIVNTNGQIVKSINKQGSLGVNNFQLESIGLIKTTYILKVITDNGSFYTKVNFL